MTPQTRKNPSPHIVLAHDWIVARRGGEAVLESIAAAAQDLGPLGPLLTMFDNGTRIGPHTDVLPREVSLLQLLPGADRLRRWLLPAYQAAVAELSQRLAAHHAHRPVDLVISTSSAAMLGLWAPIGVPHLCYLHTPARYLWNQAASYAQASGVQGFGLALLGNTLRELDREAARGVTRFLANSRHTAALTRACYGREASVLHPPVRTEYFTPPDTPRRDEFWLAAGALEPYKRFDLAIEAARIAGVQLVIVGRGSCLDQLRSGAGDRVRFVTDASDEVLRALMRRARLLIFPQIEDFGIVAVEAQACGLPVVARRAGGALDTVIDGVTGRLFSSETPEDLAFAASHCPAPDVPAIRRNAERFAEANFTRSFRQIAESVLTTRR